MGALWDNWPHDGAQPWQPLYTDPDPIEFYYVGFDVVWKADYILINDAPTNDNVVQFTTGNHKTKVSILKTFSRTKLKKIIIQPLNIKRGSIKKTPMYHFRKIPLKKIRRIIVPVGKFKRQIHTTTLNKHIISTRTKHHLFERYNRKARTISCKSSKFTPTIMRNKKRQLAKNYALPDWRFGKIYHYGYISRCKMFFKVNDFRYGGIPSKVNTHVRTGVYKGIFTRQYNRYRIVNNRPLYYKKTMNYSKSKAYYNQSSKFSIFSYYSTCDVDWNKTTSFNSNNFMVGRKLLSYNTWVYGVDTGEKMASFWYYRRIYQGSIRMASGFSSKRVLKFFIGGVWVDGTVYHNHVLWYSSKKYYHREKNERKINQIHYKFTSNIHKISSFMNIMKMKYKPKTYIMPVEKIKFSKLHKSVRLWNGSKHKANMIKSMVYDMRFINQNRWWPGIKWKYGDADGKGEIIPLASNGGVSVLWDLIGESGNENCIEYTWEVITPGGSGVAQIRMTARDFYEHVDFPTYRPAPRIYNGGRPIWKYYAMPIENIPSDLITVTNDEEIPLGTSGVSLKPTIVEDLAIHTKWKTLVGKKGLTFVFPIPYGRMGQWQPVQKTARISFGRGAMYRTKDRTTSGRISG